jgi:protocatechuate 3,4-dioxygenase beta subunit
VSTNAKLVAGVVALALVVAIVSWRAFLMERDAGPDIAALPSALAQSSTSEPSRRADDTPLDAPQRVALPANVPANAPAPAPTVSPHVIDRDHDLHGVVLAPDGSPLAGARIDVFRASSEGTSSITGPSPASLRRRIAEVQTDAHGEFAVPLERGYAHDLEVRAAHCSLELLTKCNAGERVVVRMRRASALAGRVVRRDDGAPIADARVLVNIYPGGMPHVAELRTDDDGRYRADDVPIADLIVWVRAPGRGASASARVSIFESDDARVDFALPIGAVLHGTVVDNVDGHPIENAEISEHAFWDDGVVRSDARGEFTLAGLNAPATGASGSQKIFARAEGYALVRVDAVAPDGTRFEPRLTIRLPREVRVRGRVVDRIGRPIEGARIAVTFPNTYSDGVVATSDASGLFDLRNLGRYGNGVHVSKDGFGDRAIPWDTAARPADLGDIRLDPAASISGVLRDESGRPIPRLELRLVGRPRSTPWFGRASRTCRTDDVGRFAITNLAADEYTLSANWLASSTPVTARIVLASGEDLRDLELVLPRGLAISGIVHSSYGIPLAHVRVEMRRQTNGAESERWFATTTDRAGRFEAQGLPPGRFALVFHPEKADVDDDPLRLSSRVLSGIEAGERDLDVQLERAESLLVAVREPSGMPADAHVLVFDAEHGVEVTRIRTYIDGRVGFVLDRTRLWNIVAAPVRADSGDGSPDLDPARCARADGIAPGGPDVELRLPPR